MTEPLESIQQCEGQIEKALWSLEVKGQNEQALQVYQQAEARLLALKIPVGDANYVQVQRVLAYCLMRQGNLLRQLGHPAEAMALSEREIAAARASGDPITLARSLMSTGANHIVAGRVEQGMGLLQEARMLFESGDSYDHKQGVGWCWILQADVINAGLAPGEPMQVIEAAANALAILLPIENWSGVARAYAARAVALERLGDHQAAQSDRETQKQAESKIQPDEDGAG